MGRYPLGDEMIKTSYVAARPLIADGDLIAIRSNGGGLPALTRFFTQSPYTHTAVAIWLADGLWLAEMGAGGNVLIPASRYIDADFDVFSSPVGVDAVREAIQESLRGKVDYDVVDLIRIALHNMLNFKLPTDTGGKICSSYNSIIYTASGWIAPEDMPSIPSPADIVAALGLPRLQVRILK